jgi:hypothetical protein
VCDGAYVLLLRSLFKIFFILFSKKTPIQPYIKNTIIVMPSLFRKKILASIHDRKEFHLSLFIPRNITNIQI